VRVATAADEMHDPRFSEVPHAVTPCADSPAEIDILEIHEEGLIQAAALLQKR
jgi:hypothetical protein